MVILSVFLSLTVGAQTSSGPYWFTLEQGKFYFRSQDYGNALVSFEEARRQRQNMYTRMEQDLISVLSIPEVRRFNDSLSSVEKYISDRNVINASKALDELYYRFPKSTFHDSADEALKALGSLKEYPEAEYWIGEVFRAEGELGVALRQYQRAYDLRSRLETPDFAVEILYRIADLRKIRQEYALMENTYLEILNSDALWSDPDTFIKNSMNRVLENDGVDRFLTVYRYDNYYAEKAHRVLGFFYYASGRHAKAADHLLFSFLIQNSIIIRDMLDNQFDYSFTTTKDMMNRIPGNMDLQKYALEAEYYKTIYYLGSAFYGNGKLKAARDFWGLLAGRPEAGEWRSRSEAQLKSPFIEKINEMP